MKPPNLSLIALLFIGGSLASSGQSVLPDQSPARPFNLDIAGPVYQAGSDLDSAAFQANTLPDLQRFISTNLGERQALSSSTIKSWAIDPQTLRLTQDSDVRVYFVGEGAGYHNTLTYSTTGGISQSTLIFPDASSSSSYFYETDTQESLSRRSTSTPVMAGDFVDLGTLSGGADLDFMLIANGANGGTDVWSTDSGYNADGIQHAVAFAVEDSPYLLIGFEDLYGGGDLDYNDLMFAVDIGMANVDFLANPEPAAFLLLLPLGAWLFWRKKFGTSNPA